MTLRRCDSLPTRFREAPPSSPPRPQHKKLPDSYTVPNFAEPPDRDQVIATWKSLHTDVKKIKNGYPTKSEPANHEADKKSITHNFVPTVTCNNRRITYENRPVVQEVDRCSSFPLDTGQPKASVRMNLVPRRTLLDRILSWRKRDCDCQDRCAAKYCPAPKLRPEDLLCTCGVSRNRFALRDCKKYAERGRSKSVGYVAAREVTQFRRCASAGASVGAETAAALRARAALTLARRYYPEGGWGWTITVVGTIVQVLSHGLQLGGGPGAIACTAAVKFRVSPLYTHGDSGYPQRPWLMTPILNAEPGSQEDVYTRRHVQARSRIERCFGLLKARWRCMLRHRVLHYHPGIASKITNACCVLHNIALYARLPPPSDMPASGLEGSEDHSVEDSTSTNDDRNALVRGRAMRNVLVSRM